MQRVINIGMEKYTPQANDILSINFGTYQLIESQEYGYDYSIMDRHSGLIIKDITVEQLEFAINQNQGDI